MMVLNSLRLFGSIFMLHESFNKIFDIADHVSFAYLLQISTLFAQHIFNNFNCMTPIFTNKNLFSWDFSRKRAENSWKL
jgi:hypothetical protein